MSLTTQPIVTALMLLRMPLSMDNLEKAKAVISDSEISDMKCLYSDSEASMAETSSICRQVLNSGMADAYARSWAEKSYGHDHDFDIETLRTLCADRLEEMLLPEPKQPSTLMGEQFSP